ncbi:MAG: DUF1684 domain-containing protein [Bdellovibrionaceae bacterium]|nr:DUF1684 domain-containing protein [Pseudobdellovibrionaceae bacterium]
MIRSVILILSLICSPVSADWKSDMEVFRKENEESLKKNWLVVVGLFWLREGENTLGSSPSSFIKMPKSTPDIFGKIILRTGKAEIEFTAVENVKLGGQPVKAGTKYPLKTDQDADKTVIEVNNVSMYLIQRPNGIGLRVKDSEADALGRFKGLKWWPAQEKFLVQGKWKEIKPAKILRVPDILGNIYDESINGSVEFTFGKATYELFPTRKGDDLFFVFKDATSGRSTYGTGRFLEAKVQADGKVTLDFNRAYNPPCAHIKYATCPMAPTDNVLSFSIEAGEKTTGTGPRVGKTKKKRRRR